MKKPKPSGYLTGRLYNMNGDSTLVKVPWTMTTIPEIPQVVIYKNSGFILGNSNPLTYFETITAKVKPV